MAYFVGKLAWLLLKPSNFLLLLTAAGAVAVLAGGQRWGRPLLALGTGLLLLCTLLPVGLWLTLPLENRFPRPPAYPDRVDGVVVLGGGVRTALTAARGLASFDQTMERFATSDLAQRGIDVEVHAVLMLAGMFLWPEWVRSQARSAKECDEMAGRFTSELLRLTFHGVLRRELQKVPPVLAAFDDEQFAASRPAAAAFWSAVILHRFGLVGAGVRTDAPGPFDPKR